MDDKPRHILQDIARTYGRGVLSDPRRCKALLMDLCGEYRGEINLLDMALREGVPDELMSAVSSVPRGLHIARLVQRLKDGYFLPEEAARWAVDACAAAIDPRGTDCDAARVFRSTVAATLSAREWMSGERAWTDIGLTPGEVDLPPGLEVRLSVRTDDAGARKLADDIATAGRIHQLDLSYSAITDRGLVPLLALDGVTTLNLSRTSISLSALPVEGVQLGLRELNLWGATGLTDAGLRNLAQFEALERVELGRCREITDAGIAHASRLRRLTYLGLSGTRVSDRGLAALAELTSLRELDLSATGITGAGLSYLSANPVLESLDLFGCVSLQSESLAVLRQFSGLAELRLGRCGLIVDQALAYVRPLVGLSGLSLEGLAISDAGMLYLRDLTMLSHLDLAWTQIGDVGVARIAVLRSVRDLCLAGTRITDTGLTSLMRLPDLEGLDVSNTRVTDAGLRAVGGMQALVVLDLEGTDIHDAGIVHLGALPELRQLYLGSTAITDVGLSLLGRVTNVERVDVALCSGVSPQGIDALMQSGVLVTQ